MAQKEGTKGSKRRKVNRILSESCESLTYVCQFSELNSECDSTPERLRSETASAGPAAGTALPGDIEAARSVEGRRTRARTRADLESSTKAAQVRALLSSCLIFTYPFHLREHQS